MWASALLPSFVWQLLCNAQAQLQCHLCHCVHQHGHSELIKHSLCKTFSNRPGPSLESYVSSALQIPEDLLHLFQGLYSPCTFSKEERRGFSLMGLTAQMCAGQQHPQVSAGLGLRAAGEWGKGHFRHLGRWVQQWLWSSVSYELTTHHSDTLKCFIKTVSVSWLLWANPRTQDRSQDTMKGLGACSSPSLLRASTLTEVVILCWTVPCMDYCTKFSHGKFSHSKTLEVFALFGTGQGSLRALWKSHHGTLLRLCSSKQVSPFHILLKSESHFSALEVSSPRSSQSHS